MLCGALHLIVRRSARGSTMFRRGSASSASADPAMAAGPAGPSTRHLRQNGRSPKAWLPRPCSPTSWSPNTAITCLFTGKARSSPGRASRSIGPPWRTGSAVPAGGWSHCSKGSPTTSSHHKSYCRLPTTPRSRCCILAGAALRPAGSGSTPGITDPGRTMIKLNDVEPFAYLTDVLKRMSNGYPASRLDDLLPWNWRRSATGRHTL